MIYVNYNYSMSLYDLCNTYACNVTLKYDRIFFLILAIMMRIYRNIN